MAFDPDVAQLAAAANGFHPAEDFLHPLADTLADHVAGPFCAAVDDVTASVRGDVPGHLGCHPKRSASVNELVGVVRLVTGHRPPPATNTMALEHPQRGVTFRTTAGRRHDHVHHHAVAGLLQCGCRTRPLYPMPAAVAPPTNRVTG